jgi:hypothetical protein
MSNFKLWCLGITVSLGKCHFKKFWNEVNLRSICQFEVNFIKFAEHTCYRCDVACHDYDVHQQQGQVVIGELHTSSATSHLVYEKYKEDRREKIETLLI